jgi:hypothetical protein
MSLRRLIRWAEDARRRFAAAISTSLPIFLTKPLVVIGKAQHAVDFPCMVVSWGAPLNVAARLTPRIVSLPTDLARHEILMTFERLSDEAIKEIVDGVFLPLVHPDQRASS